jgi:hypothetical protein
MKLITGLLALALATSMIAACGRDTQSASDITYPSSNADILMDAFNTNYFVDDGNGSGHYSSQYASVSTTPPGFWEQAELIEGAEDAATRNSKYVATVSALLNGFLAKQTTNWITDKYNDDLMWGVIAFVRGYQLTGNTSYLADAKSNFDAAWARGYDPVNDGMWWNTSNDSKPIAVQGPTTVAAYLLGDALNDATYKQKSLDILMYIIKYYYVSSNGAVHSYQIGSRSPNPIMPHAQALFIRSADLNGYNSYAELTLSYMTSMGQITPTSNGNKILPNYGINTVNSYNDGIALRWASFYVQEHNLQRQYMGWLQANAAAAWGVRDPSRNLSWDDWYDATPAGQTLLAWDCVSSLVALQVVPMTN